MSTARSSPLIKLRPGLGTVSYPIVHESGMTWLPVSVAAQAELDHARVPVDAQAEHAGAAAT